MEVREIKNQELIERLNTEFAETAPESARILTVIERWPLTVDDVEIYAEFSGDTALHGEHLKSFLHEAIKAKRERKF